MTGIVFGRSNIVKFRLTANSVVQRDKIYPMTTLKYKLLVADLALERKDWKKNAIPI